MAKTHVVGCILGTAVGDAIGLPYEGLSRRRAAKLFGPPDRHRFVLGHGMVSDDTEHTCIVAQSLIAASDVDTFLRQLSWRLRLWSLGLPAGIGLATLRSILRLWFGFSPKNSGVFSAGNGPAMRAAILGSAISELSTLGNFVRASSRITHTDPKAEYGAFAVALAAHTATHNTAVTPSEYLNQLQTYLHEDANELIDLLENAADSASKGNTTLSFANALGLHKGVSGYVYHSVPVALHAWFSHPKDFRSAIISVIECGGDTDSTAAIAGGIVGASVGKHGIPTHWLKRLSEWPRSVAWMEQLGSQLAANSEAQRPLSLPLWGLLARNVLFLAVVLFHGFRRLFPPY